MSKTIHRCQIQLWVLSVVYTHDLITYIFIAPRVTTNWSYHSGDWVGGKNDAFILGFAII